MPFERHAPRRRDTLRGIFKFFIVNLVAAALAVAGLVIFLTLQDTPPAADLGPPATDLNPLERIGLTAYLSLYRQTLNTPAGADLTPIAFEVQPGEDAGTVAARLVDLGLVSDADLLRLYMRYKGLDDEIEAGNFTLNKAMTIRLVAEALTQATPDEVQFRIWEGWRVEQVANSLTSQPHLNFDSDEFFQRIAPGAERTNNYSFLADLPSTASLEGFLFPDTYRFSPGADTEEILNRFLAEFDRKVTLQLRTDAQARGFSLFQIIILASIVEREAVHDAERPLIASVYLNRLAISMNLDADPTTQYAIATAADWWPRLDFDPRTIDHPYNTYVYPGLPPGPIANPGLASIQAVIYPAQTSYYYFRAKCDGSKYHNFSVTYQEHLANGCP